jgi:hypothetical protein
MRTPKQIRTVRTLAQSAGRRRAKRKERRKPTPFETLFPPIKDRNLPKDGAAYL